MNKKGFTTVELIVTFTLVVVITFFLFELILTMKDIFSTAGVKVKLLSNQAVLSEKINYDFRTKEIIYATRCGTECAEFQFSDGEKKQLSYSRTKGEITYGDFKDKIPSGSQFGNIKISVQTLATVADYDSLNAILKINIPIYSKFIKGEDFGVNVVYQFNSLKAALSGLNVNDIVDAEMQILLIGNNNDITFEGIQYNDPGFYLIDKNTDVISLNDARVKVENKIGTEVGKEYEISYRYYDMNNKLMAEAVRTVTLIKSTYDFEYTGNAQNFKAPINGIYQLELWGASGGGIDQMSGKGAYTIGNMEFTKDQELKVYIGEAGKIGTAGASAVGGYNGGGNSGSSSALFAGSGGGATDIRENAGTALSDRLVIAGGGGGAGSRNDSSFVCTGGAGGGLTGACSADSYLGGGGTASSGGAAATYSTNVTTAPTAGSSGIGGNGGNYVSGTTTSSGGGGGGGLYGGGGGVRFGGGGGGSSYCGRLTSCSMLNGTQSFKTPNNKGFKNGHTGNGYARITLISVTG